MNSTSTALNNTVQLIQNTNTEFCNHTHITMTTGEVHLSDVSVFLNTVTVKQSLYRPGQAISARWFRYPEFLDNQHMKVVLCTSLSLLAIYNNSKDSRL